MQTLEFVRKSLHEISLHSDVIGGQFTKLINTGTNLFVGKIFIVFSYPIESNYESCIAEE